MEATVWTLLPPVVAIVLALITKEVYSSLLVGILAGALLYTGFHPIQAMETTFEIMTEKIGENGYILIFLVILGILVALITRSGASRAYGNWATKAIQSRRGALLATSALGTLIFVDDYFNCLTVGTVMRPVTDKYGVSRAKLAYIIDATAAPICIISPISSWAAAVGSSLPEDSGIDGFSLFLKTIPFNLYAILTILFLLFIMLRDVDFFKMADYDVTKKEEAGSVQEEKIVITGHGKVIDLVLPIIVLIISCIGFMLYTGGLFSGNNLVAAFADCESAKSLVLGSFLTLLFTFALYLPRKVLKFSECCEGFTSGFKAMVPAIFILCLAWSLSGVCSKEYLNIGGFVSKIVDVETGAAMIIPALFFLVALGLAFATGTSWGTFGILIPITVAVFGDGGEMLVLTVAAVLAGAVCGDHISPISDTTILASAGAECNHIDHVSTQIPYVLCVAACCLIGFLAGGIAQSGIAALITGIIALIIVLWLLMKFANGKEKHSAVDEI